MMPVFEKQWKSMGLEDKEKDDLTERERSEIKKLIDRLEESL